MRKFSSQGAFFVCKRAEICYNVGMQKKDNEQSQGFIGSLVGEWTPSKRAGVLYTLLTVAFVVASFLLSCIPRGEEEPQWFLYCGYLAAPAAFAAVIAWYFKNTKTSLKDFFKEQTCSPKYYLLAILLQLGLFPLGELHGLFLTFLERFGYVPTEPKIPSTEGFGVVGVLFVIAVLPAIMEEFFFRGVFQREMRDFSLVGRVLLCGGLFALFHQNPAQTVYQFACGAAFALLAARAGSFLPTVLSHFVNNALVILLNAFGVTAYPTSAYVGALIAGGLSLIGTLFYLIFVDKSKEKKEKKGSYAQLFACAAVGVFIVGLSWIATLVEGL